MNWRDYDSNREYPIDAELEFLESWGSEGKVSDREMIKYEEVYQDLRHRVNAEMGAKNLVGFNLPLPKRTPFTERQKDYFSEAVANIKEALARNEKITFPVQFAKDEPPAEDSVSAQDIKRGDDLLDIVENMTDYQRERLKELINND